MPGAARTKPALSLDPVVGWLVAIAGPAMGRDFRVRWGNNSIGRDADQKVCLSDDQAVHGREHAFIVYDPRSNQFLLRAGTRQSLVWIDDNSGEPGVDNFKLVVDHAQLLPFHVIMLGESKLVFVPFCGESFVWDMSGKARGGGRL
ncbi:MAG: FHA domain-containing protein [Vicinamibacterales bacterium]